MGKICVFNTNDILNKANEIILCNKEKMFQLCVDNMQHVDDIYKVYDQVWITNRNIHQILDKNDKKSFYHSGGMFYKPSKEELNDLLEDNLTSIVTLAGKDEVMGMLSATIDMKEMKDLKYEKVTEKTEDFIRALNENKVFNILDAIILTKGMAYSLFYSVCKEFWELKYKYWVGEIYTILGYEQNGIYTILNHRNNSSSTLLENFGGWIIGNWRNKEFVYGDIKVIVKRNLYAVHLEQSLEIMESRIKG